MEIKLTEITIRDVVDGYEDLEEEGVTGYGGRLNIRPKYQREFRYNGKQRDEVIHTIVQGFPLNTMYWMKTEDGTFELLDGQQRTVSFCQYYDGVFSFDDKYFHNHKEIFPLINLIVAGSSPVRRSKEIAGRWPKNHLPAFLSHRVFGNLSHRIP